MQTTYLNPSERGAVRSTPCHCYKTERSCGEEADSCRSWHPFLLNDLGKLRVGLGKLKNLVEICLCLLGKL